MPGRILASQQIYSGQALKLRVDTIEKPDGNKVRREIVEHADCIAVVVLDEYKNVVMVKQLREAVDKLLLEIPAGGIDSGETPADAVHRELQEEIGFLPQKIDRIGGFYSTPGYCTEYLYLYLATELKPSRLEADDTENIKVEKVPVSQIPALIASGAICDAKSIAGLLSYIYLKSQ
ncbi:NUDIX hydrolase [Chloroflexota bacterium]